MTDYIQARKNMVNGQIRPFGVVREDILESFSTIARELFVPEKLQEISYVDKNISLGQGRFMLEPAIYARLLQELDPSHDDVVLDIGVGSGYSSAILSSLVMTIIAIENNKRQMDKASRVWNKLEICNVALIEGALRDGYAQEAPYDLIIINGSIPFVPENILEQLSPKGRLACFIRQQDQAFGCATLFYKSEQGDISSKYLFDAGVPFLDEYMEETPFVF